MSRDRVFELFAQDPQPSLREIAERVGLSRERVRQILASRGLKSARKPEGRPAVREPATPWANRFGHPRKVSTQSLGAVGELIVAADLLARGWDVYRAISGNCACDLVACDGPRSYRIEVRSARVRADGSWSYAHPGKVRERYDVLALVTPDAQIEYRPDVITGEEPQT